MKTFKKIHSKDIQIGQIVFDSDEETMFELVKRDELGDPWFEPLNGLNGYMQMDGLVGFSDCHVWLILDE